MHEAKITPERLARTVTHLGPAFQKLLTPQEQEELSALVEQIQAAPDDRARRRPGLDLVDWLAAHPAVQERVYLELALLADLREELRDALTQEAARLGLSPRNLDDYVEATLRGIQPEVTLGKGEATRHVFTTPGKATLVSLRNVWLHPGDLLEFLVSAGLAVGDAMNQPKGVLLGFGLLWLVLSLYKLATEEITGEDAAVLWGVWHACGRTHSEAPLHRIQDEANKAARQAGLPALSAQTVERSLHRLGKLGIVERSEGERWRLREKCRDHPFR